MYKVLNPISFRGVRKERGTVIDPTPDEVKAFGPKYLLKVIVGAVIEAEEAKAETKEESTDMDKMNRKELNEYAADATDLTDDEIKECSTKAELIELIELSAT